MRKILVIAAFSLLPVFLFGCQTDEDARRESIVEEYSTITNDENEAEKIEEKDHIVKVVDANGALFKEIVVPHGGKVDLSDVEIIDKNNFMGWLGDVEEVTSDEVISASYSTDPLGFFFGASTVEAKAGEEVLVSVYVKNNPGIIGAMISISYDEQILTLKDAKVGGAFSPLKITPSGEYKSGCNFLWDADKILDEDIKDGTILSLYFTVSNSAKNERCDITLNCRTSDVVDRNLKTINPEIINGAIVIK